MNLILIIIAAVLVIIGAVVVFFGLAIAYMIWIDKLIKYTRRKWCYFFHTKSLNIVITSVGSVSHEYCYKCRLKH